MTTTTITMSIVILLFIILTLVLQLAWHNAGCLRLLSWCLLSLLAIFLEEEARRHKHESENKDTFVSIAAHQIRNPLTGIKWALDLLARGKLNALEAADLLKKTYEQNERLILLVNDLLNVSRISAGRFVYHMTPTNLTTLWNDVEQTLRLPLEQKKLLLVRHLINLPPLIIDHEKMALALQNLLDNAIKYTPAGQQIDVVFLSHPDNVEIQLRDRGMGIPADQQKDIFARFFRARNAQRSGQAGTGLGLYLTKKIVEHHNGRVWFESVENVGTTFHIILPLKTK